MGDTMTENQFMRGFTLTVVMFALIHAAEPYFASLATKTIESLAIAGLMVIAYGIFLMVTSPLSIEFLENVERTAKSFRG